MVPFSTPGRPGLLHPGSIASPLLRDQDRLLCGQPSPRICCVPFVQVSHQCCPRLAIASRLPLPDQNDYDLNGLRITFGLIKLAGRNAAMSWFSGLPVAFHPAELSCMDPQ